METVAPRLITKFTLGQHATAQSRGRSVLKAMKGSTNFSNAGPAIAAAESGLDMLQTLAAGPKSLGGAAAVQKQLRVCRGLFDALKGIVQQAADSDVANAEAIIKSASMGVKKRPAPKVKAELEVKYGNVSGMALLIAKSFGRASYLWQMSTDGLNWSPLPMTLRANTAVHGLTPGVKYFFRLKVTTKNGERDWTQTVSLLMK
jgi:hypothetical protein